MSSCAPSATASSAVAVRGVYCEEDGTHFSGATSGDEAGCVPSGGELRREERVEGVDDFCEGGGF